MKNKHKSMAEIQTLDEDQTHKQNFCSGTSTQLFSLWSYNSRLPSVQRLRGLTIVSLKEQNNSKVGKKMNLRDNFKYDAKISLFVLHNQRGKKYKLAQPSLSKAEQILFLRWHLFGIVYQ